jgi:hypothetical protein
VLATTARRREGTLNQLAAIRKDLDHASVEALRMRL